MQTTTRIEEKNVELKNVSNGIPNIGAGPKQHRPWWRKTGETIVAATICICLLETFFNFAGIGQQEFFEPDPLLGARHIPSKQVTWRMEGLSRDSFNKFGMRDYERTIAKEAGVTRIAVLGDSAAEGLQVPLEETFPVVLEKMLNADAKFNGSGKRFEVLNFGCAGYSTAQEVLQYESQVAQFAPDLVVLFYNYKDSAESIIDNTMRAVSEPKPYFYLNQKGDLALDNAVMEGRADELKPNPVFDWLRRNSRIYGVINQTQFSLAVNDKRYVKLKQWFMQMQHKQRPKIAPAQYGQQNPEAVVAKLVERLNNQVKAGGGRLVLMMFPNTIGYKDLAREQAMFSKMAQTDNFDYLDLSKPFIDHKNKSELVIEYHFSQKGHKLLADLLKPVVHQ